MSTDLKAEAQALTTKAASLNDADATEYRGVSVLMADLVASTGRMEELGAEGYAELLRRFHTICNDAVRTRGGTVAQYQGDGIICYFGFPRAREDDAVRAVEAALDIVEALRRTVGQDQIETRLGISSGTVMLRSDGDQFGASAVGTAINRAARLEAIADANTIMVCEDTQKLVGTSFQMRDLGPQTLKGFRQPQRVFCVQRARSGVTTRFEALRGHQTTDLIGRDTDLTRLRDTFEAARTSGSGTAMVISADPGFGKSRLVSAFLQDQSTDGAPCFLLQCSPEHVGTPLHPVSRYLEWVAGTGTQDDDDTRHSKIKRLVTRVWGADEGETNVLLDLLSPLGAETEIDMSESVPLRRNRALTLLANKILTSVAGRGAFVVVFEDVHWIDPTSALLLEVLTARIHDYAAMLVMTTRREPLYGDGVEGAELMRLQPLSDAHSLTLARQTMGASGVDDDQIARIIEKSEGVPLFIQEYADMLRNGVSMGERDVPLTLGGLVQSKLDRLDKPARHFAQVAAALGREFDPRLVGDVMERAEDAIDAFSRALTDQKLADPMPGTDGGLIFSHALVRDAIYNGMHGDRRRRVHEAIATNFLNMGDRIPVEDHVLADHLNRAGRHGEAVQRFLSAGMAATGQGAAGEAMAHLDAGLACIPALPVGPQRDMLELQLCAVRGPTLMVTGGPGNPAFGECQARAMELLELLDMHAKMIPVIFYTAEHAWAVANLDRAQIMAQAIQRIDSNFPSDAAHMAGNLLTGMVLWHRGENAETAEALERVRARYDTEKHTALYVDFIKDFGVFSHFYLGLTRTIQGDFEEGKRLADGAVAVADHMSFPHEVGFAQLAQFNTAMLRGDVETALDYSTRAIEFSTLQGFPEFVAMGLFIQGWAKARKGELEAGVAGMEDGFAMWRATGFACWQALFAAILGPDLVALGRLDEAEAMVDHYTALINETGENQPRAPLLLARAVCRDARGEDYDSLLAQARKVATAQGGHLWLDWINARFPA